MKSESEVDRMSKPVYLDIADFDEDARVDVIGRAVMEQKKTSAFIVEDDAKADRYLKKLKKRFPGIRLIARGDGPVKDTVFVKLGPPVN
jgi:hypothetical protein